MDLSIVSQFMSLTPDMMYKATKMVESAAAYFPGDAESQEEYLRENLIDQTLDYALTLLEDKKVRDYMGVAVYTNGTTFSAPTLALYNVASMPEMKQRIQAKLNAKGGQRNEEVEVIDEKKRPKLKGRKFNGKNPWWNSDGDDKPYEPGDDVKKTRKEAVDYVAELWRNRQLQEDETVDEAMRPGPRQRKLAGKQYQTYGVTTRDRANAHNIAVRGDGPGTPGYEKKSTGGKGARYAGYGDQGAGNKARRRSGLEPLRGTRDPRNEEFTVEAKNKEGKEQGADGKACWKGYKYAGTEKGKDKCVPMESVAEFAAEYFISEGLNEYGIDILIEEMGIDAFCDYVETLAQEEEVLLEWRRGAGGTKVRGSGMSKSGKSIGSLKGGAKASAIRGTAEHKGRKAEKEKEGSKSSGMTAALKSQSKVANAKKSQPATKSTPTQTKEKAKGGILGALKARAEKDIKSVQQSVNTVRQVGARRAAEVKATYDAVRAKGKEAEKSAAATRARRKATVAAGRAAQAAGRTAVKAAGAAGAAAGQAVAARRSGATAAQAAGRAAGTFVKKMKKEEKELLTRYFIESEIAFNYDEVQEIFETLDQEHFDYFLEQATLMVEESGPSARELIEEKLQNSFDIERFTFADWRQLTEKKSSDDDATGKFVSLTQTNRTDNTPDVKGKRKDGVIINPQVDMRREEVEQIDEVSPPGAKFKRMAKHIKAGYAEDGLTKREKAIAFATAWKQYKKQEEQVDPEAAKSAAQSQQRMKSQQQMQRKQLMLQQQRLQMQKQGKLPMGHMEEVEHVDEANRYAKETGKSFRTGKPTVQGGTAKNDKAFQMISKMMGSSRAGVQPRGQKKVPGKKPPEAGKYGSERESPAQTVAKRRAAAQRAKDNMSSRFD
jgi:hypothetical protein